MIISFRHKGLEVFFKTGKTKGIQAAHAQRLRRQLLALSEANNPGDMNQVGWRLHSLKGTVAKLAMRQPFVLFKGLTFQKLCLPGAFRPGDHHNKMLRPGLCVVHASPQYL
ncbi:type II toxin-antitoxin system RelE/ParE family toxin [Pseudomonas aeruginosa]|uniref:type II toxin-antitoxin system RelE/ParE family toxin n=1 Tax=Pseudomonas aeruginosa TaxID=287 RepID=UPI0023A9D1D5|nr:type II toxin-antitoxin system RelE/ParE family toxin [Pseudomonas aeruginosa]MDE5244203.1 type II toxin-antitoxin system RelE/ParE family toxin [Pseudomonas aeruginosa]